MDVRTPAERKLTTDRIEQVIERKDNLDLVLAQIPGKFGTDMRATYLGFRAVGLSKSDALLVLELKNKDYDGWLAETPELADYENEHLVELQRRVGPEIVRLGFTRNMTLFMMLDHRVLRKAHTDFNSMSDREAEYLKAARRHYTPKMMLDMERALEPEKHRQTQIVLNYGNGGGMYEIIDGDSGQTESGELPSLDSPARDEGI